MPAEPYQPLVHRMAVLTACAALLPIVVGALVTTMKWGMAFLDWPTSDGHNMFLYPWLMAGADKFTEHGHRLAGALIGIVSIALAVAAWAKERRRWVKWLATVVLLAVIVQGVLGGQRVLMNEQTLAMLHGSFAALVFALMAGLALCTSRAWHEAERVKCSGIDLRRLRPLVLITPLVIFGQYMVGGLVRHLGTALYEHIAVAVVALLFIVATAVSVHRSRIAWLCRPGYVMGCIALVQIGLGAGAFITRFGLQGVGYVAVHNSLPNVLLRTSHTVVGMLLLMTSVVLALRVLRLWSAAATAARPVRASAFRQDTVPAEGGAR